MFAHPLLLVNRLSIRIIFITRIASGVSSGIATRILTRQLILGYHLAHCLLLEGQRLDHLREVNTRTEDDVRALGTEIIL